jgi:hypothetical protein
MAAATAPPQLPTAFLVRNPLYKEISFKDIQVGHYYCMEEIVIEYYCQYDYVIYIASKDANTIKVEKIHQRLNDNMMEPGDWMVSEEDPEILTSENVDKGCIGEAILRFYAAV